MIEAVQTGQELIEWFSSIDKLNDYNKKKYLNSGCNVSTKVRREVLTSVDQGRITIGGNVKKIAFKNIGGGVWNATLCDL